MAKHHSPLFDQMLVEAATKGIRVVDKGNGVFILYPSDKTKPMHTFHRGVLGEKPLRKWLDKNS